MIKMLVVYDYFGTVQAEIVSADDWKYVSDVVSASRTIRSAACYTGADLLGNYFLANGLPAGRVVGKLKPAGGVVRYY